jgi:hypothetical protein
VFAFDRVSGQTERISLDASGNQLTTGSEFCGVSRDGSTVAYATGDGQSPCGNSGLVLLDRGTGERTCVNAQWQGSDLWSGGYCSLSADGQRVALLSSYEDSNGDYQNAVFLWNRAGGVVQQLTPPRPNSQYGTPRACANGNCVVFSTREYGLVDDDGNRAFSDVFIALGLDDALFADDFEQQL